MPNPSTPFDTITEGNYYLTLTDEQKVPYLEALMITWCTRALEAEFALTSAIGKITEYSALLTKSIENYDKLYHLYKELSDATTPANPQHSGLDKTE
jgi:hypothetical protein